MLGIEGEILGKRRLLIFTHDNIRMIICGVRNRTEAEIAATGFTVWLHTNFFDCS